MGAFTISFWITISRLPTTPLDSQYKPLRSRPEEIVLDRMPFHADSQGSVRWFPHKDMNHFVPLLPVIVRCLCQEEYLPIDLVVDCRLQASLVLQYSRNIIVGMTS